MTGTRDGGAPARGRARHYSGVPRDPLDRLFEAPPDEFITERGELVRSLKEKGKDDLAAEAKALRKPTLPAWALNQLARRRRKDLQALLAASLDLRGAQRGGDPEKLRRLAQRRRELILTLTEAAGEIVAEQGTPTDASRRAIEVTLESASADPGAGEELLRGRLTRPLELATGFDALGGLAAVPGTGGGEPDQASKARAESRLQRTLDEARRRLEDAEKDLRRAVMRAESLDAEAERVAARAREARADIAGRRTARNEARQKVRKAERAIKPPSR
jgi:hypothetical protein